MKKKVKKTVFRTIQLKPIQWKNLKEFSFEDEDMIFVEYVDDDPDVDDYFVVIVERLVEETDEEYLERIKNEQFDQEMLKNKRYQTYLKLKEEFENGF